MIDEQTPRVARAVTTLASLPQDDIAQAVMKALDASKIVGHHTRSTAALRLEGVYRESDFVNVLVVELEIRLARLTPTPAV